MSQGKFASPRPHREEEREIEKAYRDLTRKKTHKTYEHKVTMEDIARAAQPLPTDVDVPDISIPNPEGEAFPTEEAFPDMFPNPDAAPAPAPSPADEDRQIEEAFRQVTGQPVKPRTAASVAETVVPSDVSRDSVAPEPSPYTHRFSWV